MGIVTPRGVPPAIIARLNAAFNKALVNPEVREKITSQSNIPGGGTAEDFTQLINAESVRWSSLITRTKIKVE
jgi:tripartite-type tricarboxylate transporter receptor subunit TctC